MIIVHFKEIIHLNNTTTWKSCLCSRYEKCVSTTQVTPSRGTYHVPRWKWLPLTDECSGTVHDTRVSARKRGPRARTVYSLHCGSQHETDCHGGAALPSTLACPNAILTLFLTPFLTPFLNLSRFNVFKPAANHASQDRPVSARGCQEKVTSEKAWMLTTLASSRGCSTHASPPSSRLRGGDANDSCSGCWTTLLPASCHVTFCPC